MSEAQTLSLSQEIKIAEQRLSVPELAKALGNGEVNRVKITAGGAATVEPGSVLRVGIVHR